MRNNNNFYNNNNNKPSYSNNKNPSRQPQPPPTPQPPSFSSGMTSQQKFHSIVQTVKNSLANKPSTQILKGCPMHPKISPKCRQCQVIQKQKQLQRMNKNNKIIQQQQTTVYVLQQSFPQQIKLNTQNPKNHLNQKLQTSITSAQFYKSLLPLKSIKQVLSMMPSQQTPLTPFLNKSSEIPTKFIILLYRIIQLKPTINQLKIMLSNNNVNIKALTLFYVRICVDFDQIYSILCIKFHDNRLINAEFTVGELAIKLIQENNGLEVNGIRLPRISMKIQRQIEKKINEWKDKGGKNNEDGGGEDLNEINGMGNGDLQGKQNVKRYQYGYKQKQLRKDRQRSRQNNKKNKIRSHSQQSSNSSSSSSSGSSSSFSSSSSSSSSSKQKEKPTSTPLPINTKPIPPLPLTPPPTSSLQQIRHTISQKLKQTQLQQHKTKILLQKYKATSKIQQNIRQDGELYDIQQSDQIEKYQIG